MIKTGNENNLQLNNAEVRNRRPSSDQSSEDSSSGPPVPDGGWGWVVVVSAFFTSVIVEGISGSLGVIFVQLLEHFGETKATTAWAGSIFVGTSLFSGPAVSALVNKFGCRKVAVAGSFMCGIGFALSVFATTLWALCLTFGVIAGLGCALVSVPSIVIVSYYFEEKRALATGIAMSGSGIGTLIFAPLTEQLGEYYGWPGMVLILAGISLNMAVFCALFRPVEWYMDKEDDDEDDDDDEEEGSDHDSDVFLRVPSNGSPFGTPIRSASVDLIYIEHSPTDPAGPLSLENAVSSDNPAFPEPNPEPAASPSAAETAISDPQLQLAGSSMAHPHLRHLPHRPRARTGPGAKPRHKYVLSTSVTHNPAAHPPRPGGYYINSFQLIRTDAFFRRSISIIPPNLKLKKKYHSCPNLVSAGEVDAKKRPHCVQNFACALSEIKVLLVDILDLGILKNARFLVFCVANFLLYMADDVPYIYLVDRAREIGITDSEASWLIAIIGVVSMVGQIIFGWICDKTSVNVFAMCAIPSMLAGVATFVVPHLNEFYQLVLFSVAFGFTISANYALTSILLVELLGLERLTNSYGLLMLIQGVGALVGPPIAGWLCDVTHEYEATFYSAGGGLVVAGIIILLIYLCDRKRKSVPVQQNARSNQSSASRLVDVQKIV